MRRVLLGAAGFLLLGLALQAAAAAGVPGAVDVLRAGVDLGSDPGFWTQLAGTAGTALLGVLIALALAVPAGLALGCLPALERHARVVIEFARPVPSLALIPPAILILGPGLPLRAGLAAYACAWPILFNALYGARSADPVAVDTLRAFGFPFAAIVARLHLPSAVPYVVTGVRHAVAVALIVTVGAELLAGGSAGVGTFLRDLAGGPGNRAAMLAAAVWTGVLGLALSRLLVLAERTALRRFGPAAR
ncbi:ABC transporter permease [Nonomuraea sp. NPDC059023]|uniref:ABC transporter permease n=1 Tax=unclassified Nonomuraea TaxID=2593643 RepID=UPI0036748BD2